MSPWAWAAISAPPYLVAAGYARNYFHTRPGHNQYRCEEWHDMPCGLWGGVMWPLVVVFAVIALCWKLGMHLEQQRPVHRRERRETRRNTDLRAIS